MKKNQCLFIFLLLFIYLVSCSTARRSEYPENILSFNDTAELEKILSGSSILLMDRLSWLHDDILLVETKLSYEKNPYKVEDDIKRVERKIERHKEKIYNFKKRIETTEIFLKNNSDDTLSIKLDSFREKLRKYEEIINQKEILSI